MNVTEVSLIEEYTAKGWWGQDTLDKLFSRNVAAHPQRIAVIDPPDRESFVDGKVERLNYVELDKRVTQMAAALLESGVNKDDIVVFQLPNIHEITVILLACARIGAIASPVLVQFDLNEIEQIFTQLQPKVFITVIRFKKRALAAAAQPLCDKFRCKLMASGELVSSKSDNEAKQLLADYLQRTDIDANDVSTICWTSGTEGLPKGVMRSHNQWLAIGRMMRDGAGLKQGDVLLNTRPLVNMAAIGGSFCSWLLSAGTMVLHHPLNMALAVKQIKEEKVNITFMPPAFIIALLKDKTLRAEADLSSLRMMGSGSAAIPAWAVEEIEREQKVNIVNFFGSNEGVALLSTAAEVPDPRLRASYFPRFGRSEFTWPSLPVSAQLTSRLVNPETETEISTLGQVGELRMKGSTIFSAYFKNEAQTKAAFDSEGYYCTGDLFEIAGDGELSKFYKFVGRCKEVIIRGGFNIAPAEIDNLLSNHPQIKEVAAFGYADERLGEKVGVAVVAKSGSEVTLDSIINFLKDQHIAVFKLPEKLLVMEELPRNGLLKVLRWKLTELADQQVA